MLGPQDPGGTRFADTLRDMHFVPCKADPDVWIRKAKGHYKYITVYVEDLAIIAKEPKDISDTLTNDRKVVYIHSDVLVLKS